MSNLEAEIEMIAQSNRTDKEKIKFALRQAGEKLIRYGFNITQDDPMRFKASIYRPDYREIFGYMPDGF
jgi:hypothetical protein